MPTLFRCNSLPSRTTVAGAQIAPITGSVQGFLVSAIAAVHDDAANAEDTDWAEIVALYQLLARLSDNPVVTLNQAVAVAMVDGPRAGLALLEPLDDDSRMTEQHRLDAVRAHLLEMAGEPAAARTHYLAAASRTTSLPERAYLEAKAATLR